MTKWRSGMVCVLGRTGKCALRTGIYPLQVVVEHMTRLGLRLDLPKEEGIPFVAFPPTGGAICFAAGFPLPAMSQGDHHHDTR